MDIGQLWKDSDSWVVDFLGQSPRAAGKRDVGDWDPSKGPSGGLKPPSAMEQLGNVIWRRGQDEETEAAARDAYVESLKNSKAGQDIGSIDPDFQFTGDMTKGDVRKKARELTTKDTTVESILSTGKAKLTKDELMKLDPKDLRARLLKAKEAEREQIDKTDPKTIRAIEETKKRDERYKTETLTANRRHDEKMRLAHQSRQDELTERALARADAAKTALLEFDLKKQGMANEMYMFEQRLARDERIAKREKMQALMAGLANLGGVFAI